MPLHHVFVDKGAVYELWCQCIMCFLTGEQFKSCGVNASCFGNKATVSKLWCQCFKYLSTVKQFKSCGVDASRVFVHREAV